MPTMTKTTKKAAAAHLRKLANKLEAGEEISFAYMYAHVEGDEQDTVCVSRGIHTERQTLEHFTDMAYEVLGQVMRANQEAIAEARAECEALKFSTTIADVAQKFSDMLTTKDEPDAPTPADDGHTD